MITYLGHLPLSAVLPIVATSLARVIALLENEVAAIQSDIAALRNDVAALQSDVAKLMSELASIQGLAADLERRLAQGIAGLEHAIKAAIDSILSGAALRALEQTLLGGLHALVISIENAYRDVLAKAQTLIGRIAAMQARIADIVARITRLAARLAALLAMLNELGGLGKAMASASLHAFVFQGPAGQLGSEVAGATSQGLPGGNALTQAGALVLAAAAGVNWSSIARIFKVVP